MVLHWLRISPISVVSMASDMLILGTGSIMPLFFRYSTSFCAPYFSLHSLVVFVLFFS